MRARPLVERIAVARAFEADELARFETGALRPVVDTVFPMERVAEAHERMEASLNFGKIVLRWV